MKFDRDMLVSASLEIWHKLNVSGNINSQYIEYDLLLNIILTCILPVACCHGATIVMSNCSIVWYNFCFVFATATTSNQSGAAGGHSSQS